MPGFRERIAYQLAEGFLGAVAVAFLACPQPWRAAVQIFLAGALLTAGPIALLPWRSPLVGRLSRLVANGLWLGALAAVVGRSVDAWQPLAVTAAVLGVASSAGASIVWKRSPQAPAVVVLASALLVGTGFVVQPAAVRRDLAKAMESITYRPSLRPADNWSRPGDNDVARPRHVILIMVDTLRADHLSAYGYERETSPNLDKLLRDEAIRFDASYSASSWTLPSTASMMTSLHPHQHGVEDRGKSLQPSVPTLAAAFSGQHWQTAGFVTHIYASSLFGIHSGFREWHDISIDWNYREGMQIRADQLNELVFPWLGEHRKERFFLFLHYFDPHWDYDPPAPFDTMFTDPTYEGPARGDWKFLREYLGHDALMEAADLARVEALYDGEIRFTDQQLGRLFDQLRALGLWDDTLLVITSDHGEEFQEHRSVHHIRTLYEEVLRVPLIVKLPGGRPQGWRDSVPELVGGIDVAPTILDAAGLLAPPTFEGRSLVPLMRRPGPERPVFARTVRHDSNKAALREGALKMIHTFVESRERFEAYDLATDPGETSPLDLSGAERIPDLESGLSDIMSLDRMVAEEPLEPVRLTRDQLERLRALGYAD